MSVTTRGGIGNRMREMGRVLNIDFRLLSMIAVLLVIWISFDIASNGLFLSPRNLWNLAVQTSVTGIIATGMVLVIVARNIDLSVGSLVAFLGILGGYLQTDFLPIEGTQTWWLTIVAMVFAGVVCGALQGFISAQFSIPSFVVTLGGLMFWRGAGWMLTNGETVTPLGSTFSILGGGSIGETWSWITGAAGFSVLVALMLWKRQARLRLGFELRSIYIDLILLLIAGSLIVAFVIAMNAYTYAQSSDGRGIPIPVLIMFIVIAVMTYVASMTRFGRYIYGYGGNPEAAALAGINTKRLIIIAFALTGGLSAIGAMVTISRLNAAPLSIGQLLELQVIAAAVIGGTSLSGGIGTIIGAIIGAFLMQSLQNGMVLIGVQSAPQQMIMAAVLICAVGFDVIYQKRRN